MCWESWATIEKDDGQPGSRATVRDTKFDVATALSLSAPIL